MIFKLVEKNIIPDFLLRTGVRFLISQRLKELQKESIEDEMKDKISFIEGLKKSPIAINTMNANEQHYEVPTEFYKLVLGDNLKYSSGIWSSDIQTLNESEEAMLKLTCQRAKLKNGQTVLDLGCGWGSLTFFIAKNYPKCKITSVSNSKTQREYITSLAKSKGIKNIKVITEDMNDFTIDKQFDRILSVEMLEHMKNYELLFNKISSFLKPDGLFFVHIFSHKKYQYHFEVKDETDWMSKYFFTGGIMPSDDLFLYFQNDLNIVDRWIIDGTNYSKTSEEWLNQTDANKEQVLKIFSKTYGEKEALKWFVYWRIFFIACAELFGYRNGQEWIVSHYLFKKN